VSTIVVRRPTRDGKNRDRRVSRTGKSYGTAKRDPKICQKGWRRLQSLVGSRWGTLPENGEVPITSLRERVGDKGCESEKKGKGNRELAGEKKLRDLI